LSVANRFLARLKKKWTASIYGFFKPDPIIEYVDGRLTHVFICAADVCRASTNRVRRFQDKRDKNSTGNLRTHVKKCMGPEVLEAADKAGSADAVRKTVLKNGGILSAQAITVAFDRKGKGKVTYSAMPHTKAEIR
jgi:hypothetical protein